MDMKHAREITLDGEDLDKARERLVETLQAFRRDAAERPLPAWANDRSCEYCDYAGVCRREAWRADLGDAR